MAARVAGRRDRARRERDGTVGFEGSRRRGLPRRRAAPRVPRPGRRRRDARLPPREGRRARREVPRRDGAVPRDVPRPDRPLPVREVRARRELLGDGLRHGLVHAPRAAGDPLPVHPDVVLPARDPPQLVGELGLRRLREGELVRGADGLPGRPPDPGAARQGRGVPPRDAPEVPQLRPRRARLPPHRVPRPRERRDRGDRLREVAHGLPHGAALTSATPPSGRSSPASTPTSGGGARRSTTSGRRPRPSPGSSSQGSSTRG